MFVQSDLYAATTADIRASIIPTSIERERLPELGMPDLTRLDLATLMRRCATESEHFYRGQPHDTGYAYELFRRALVDHNQDAWNQLYSHYTSLVEGWVRRSTAFTSSGESSEYFVVGAFTKFWRAITPERFITFPTLATLLHYLRLCTTSVVIDSVRAQSWAEMLPEETESATELVTAGDEALELVERAEFWHFIDAQLNDQEERIVIYGSFVLGLTPRAIFAQHTDLFSAISDIYNVKRNVLGRLSRNPQLQQMLEA